MTIESKHSLPDPLVPANCDLRDFQFMPMDIMRLFNSEFHALSSDSEWRAGVTLWMKSYHQVPAASIPDDDVMLARLAELGRDVESWKEIKEKSLRGWIKCSDGRLYHPVVAEKALEAWIEKLLNSLSGATGNAKRWDIEIDTGEIEENLAEAIRLLRNIAPHSRTLKKKAVLAIAPRSRPESPPDRPPIAKGSQGTGTGTGTGIKDTKVVNQPTVDNLTTVVNQPYDQNSEKIPEKTVETPEKPKTESPSGDGLTCGSTPFDRFWAAYPKKVGKDAARKAWKKLKKPHETLDEILQTLAWQRESEQWTKDHGQFIPNPATYLNQGRWMDERPVTSTGPPGNRRRYEKFDAADYMRGNDGYGNPRQNIIDITDFVVNEKLEIQRKDTS